MTTPTPTYREVGAERDMRFSTREATFAIKQGTIQRYAQRLVPPRAQRGLTQAGRWGVTAAIMGPWSSRACSQARSALRSAASPSGR